MGLLGGSTLAGGALDATSVYLKDLAQLHQAPTNQVLKAHVAADVANLGAPSTSLPRYLRACNLSRALLVH